MILGINMSKFKDDIDDLEQDLRKLREVYTFLHVNGIERSDLNQNEIANFRELLENLHIAYMEFEQNNSIIDMQRQIDDCTDRWIDENERGQ